MCDDFKVKSNQIAQLAASELASLIGLCEFTRRIFYMKYVPDVCVRVWLLIDTFTMFQFTLFCDHGCTGQHQPCLLI